MLRTILLSTLRQARRHPRYVALNVLGLALGLCVFLLLSQYVRYQYAYNHAIADADRIARMDLVASPEGQPTFETSGISFYALPFLRTDFPDLVAATFNRPTTVMLRANGRQQMQDIEETDADYLRAIPLKLSAGDPATALSRPDGIVLSQSVAQALFGTGSAMGRTVNVDESGVKVDATVTGILAIASGPVTINPGGLMQVPAAIRKDVTAFTHWGSTSGTLFLRFHTVADLHHAEARLRDFLIRRASGPGDDTDNVSLGPHPERRNRLILVPLSQTHFHDTMVQGESDGTNRSVVDSLGLIGLLALGLAIANAINLATARGTLRAREVAMRKTLGASRRDLIVQFMGEALALTAISGLIALSLHEFLLPMMSAVTGKAIIDDTSATIATLLVAVLITVFASGIYPALVLSALRPAAVLAASRMPSGGRINARIRNLLVLAQFTLAALIAICTLVVNRQVDFVRHSDPGYTKDGILFSPQIPGGTVAEQHHVLDALRALPGVRAASLSVLEPKIQESNWFRLILPDGRRVRTLSDVIYGDYLAVYHPHLLAGRWFDPAHGQDDGGDADDPAPQGQRNVVINASAATALGFARPQDAVGQKLKVGHAALSVIGVESDMRFVTPRADVSPLVVFYSSQAMAESPIVALRFSGVDIREMQARAREVWNQLEPDVDGSFEAADARTADFYETDRRQGQLFSAGSAVAIVIACIGLYGLASFAGTRRRQEVGIRKALGAATSHVLALMLREFLVPVLLACLVACPVAWAAMRVWLSGFSQRIALSALDFLTVTVGALAIATLTVVGQTWRVARAEPARALRAE